MKPQKFKKTEIGEIPEDWEVVKLGEKAIITMGQSPPSNTYNVDGEGLPFFQGRKDFGSRHPTITTWCSEPKKKANKGEVLLSVRAPIGDLNISNKECCIGRGLAALSWRSKNNEFLFYLLKYNQRRLESDFESGGTVFGCVGKDGLSNFLVAISNFEQEQSSIASILSSLDSKIELNQQMNKTLEAIGQAIFKHWFIDFEFPNEKGKPYKSSGGEMIDSELGKIPRGWKVSKIGDEFETILGGTPSTTNKSYWENGTIPWINSGKINEFRITEPTAFITEEAVNKSATKLMRKGTTVLAITGATLGQVSRIEIDTCANQSVIGVIENKDIPSEYVYLWIKHKIIGLISHQTGGAQQHINKNNVNELDILLPNNSLMLKFKGVMRPIFKNISINCFESQILSQIRDALLPKLMLGKIRIK